MTKNEMMQKIFQMEDSDVKEVAVKGVLNNDENIMDVLKMDGLSTKEMEETIGFLTNENNVEKEETQSRKVPFEVREDMTAEEYKEAEDHFVNTLQSVRNYENNQSNRDDYIASLQAKAKEVSDRQAERDRVRYEQEQENRRLEAERQEEERKAEERENLINEISKTSDLGHKNLRRMTDDQLNNINNGFSPNATTNEGNDDVSVTTEVTDKDINEKKGFDNLTEQEIVTLQATVDPEALSETQKKAIREELNLSDSAEITRENLLDAKDELFNLHYDPQKDETQEVSEQETDNKETKKLELSNYNSASEDPEVQEAAKGMMIKDKAKEAVASIKNKIMNFDAEKAIKVLIVVAAGAAVIASGGTTALGIGAIGGGLKYAESEFKNGQQKR